MTVASSPKQNSNLSSRLDFVDGFDRRHIGPSDADLAKMLETLGFDSLDALSDATIPSEQLSGSGDGLFILDQ